jgi:bifunctional N-acetylglucosamine-1-phosphate-uridyltransferase/glucosamine-1-phosphate-acetyltransferase GlmU-like protein
MGTGDAVNCALSHLPDDIEHVYVSFGTQPLVQNGTIHASLEHQIENGLGFTLPTTITTNPYAPLIRDADKRVVDSVETHLEGAEKLEVGEANVGAYWATIGTLNSVLTQIVASKWSGKKYNTPSGELGYPNEMVRACLDAGVSVDGIPCADPSEMIGIKRIEDVTIVENYYEMRKRWAANG